MVRLDHRALVLLHDLQLGMVVFVANWIEAALKVLCTEVRNSEYAMACTRAEVILLLYQNS